MMSCGNPDKYLCYDKAGEHQSKFAEGMWKRKITLDYRTPHTPQLNGFIEIIFSVIKEGALDILFNPKLNDTVQKILWT